jgi:pimeloyl-[acyl-carrier protein] synthase
MKSADVDSAALGFDPQSPTFRRDPYPIYARLREQAPICYRPEHDDWLLSRYADVKRVLQDARFQFLDPAETVLMEHTDWAAVQSQPPSARRVRLLRDKCVDLQNRFLDVRLPPEHTHLRQLMQPWLAPSAVSCLRPMMQALVDDLLDRAMARGELDVINDLAFPYTFGVICTVLGCPQEQANEVRTWTRDLINGIDLGADRQRHERNLWAMGRFAQYMHGILAMKAREPQDDGLSSFVQAHLRGQVGADDLLANSITLLFAGHETSQNLLGLAIRTLLRYPDHWRRLRSEPEIIRTAVEELLRYDGPIQARAHVALADVPIEGGIIRKRQRVRLLIGAANRDPRQFPDPDRIELTRQPNAHLGFFHGPHYCLGASLARLEMEVALSTLARRLPNLQLVDEPDEWLDTYFMRGLTRLRVTWEH